MTDLFSSATHLYRHYRTTAAILSRILRQPLSLEQSASIVRSRLMKRKENFLEMLEKTVFGFERSPYRILLERAGFTRGSVRELVENHGIEATLGLLYEKGVFVDLLEFKGKKNVVRGKDTFRFAEKDFSNPLLTAGLGTRSGGTRSSGTKVTVPLEYIQQHNPYNVLASHACDMMHRPVIIWLPILPAGEGLFFSLRFAAMGNAPVKWFSQVDERYIKPSLMDRLKTRSTIWMGTVYGKRMAAPEYVDMQNTAVIARWMTEHLGKAKGFSIVTYASSALRLIMVARRERLNLGATVFWLMGEPLTDKIQEEMEHSGCRAYSLYGCNELMIIGQGCARPGTPDDMHFCSDKLAVIQHKKRVEHSDLTVDAFLFTTLLETSPKIFLNTETGDYGCIETRDCGCVLGQIGFREHIHTVRSYEKLTAEGATFVGSDLLPLVQKTLPSEIGGNATDYQFLEEADQHGIPRMYVLISPEVGEIDELKVKDLIYEALTSGEYSHSYSRSYWTQAETLQIRRMRPIPTARGKIVPLQIRRGLAIQEAGIGTAGVEQQVRQG